MWSDSTGHVAVHTYIKPGAIRALHPQITRTATIHSLVLDTRSFETVISFLY